jgi:hypothetical protein
VCDEVSQQDVESLAFPKDWHSCVRNAVLNVIGIVRIAMLAGRQALITNGDVKDARFHRLECEVAMLRDRRKQPWRTQRHPRMRSHTPIIAKCEIPLSVLSFLRFQQDFLHSDPGE